jgi:hypothetical protein
MVALGKNQRAKFRIGEPLFQQRRAQPATLQIQPQRGFGSVLRIAIRQLSNPASDVEGVSHIPGSRLRCGVWRLYRVDIRKRNVSRFFPVVR